MGFVSIKEKGPRGGICRPRGLRPLEGRVHNKCTTPTFKFNRCPEKSNFRATPAFSWFARKWRGWMATKRFRLCGCLHPETFTPALIGVLRANCYSKDGLPIAITIPMNVHITGNNVSKKLRRYMERSLSIALGDSAERVVAVEVELSDINKHHTRNDNLCSIRAQLRRAGVVFVHGRSADAHTAVDRAGMRLKTALTIWPASQTYGRFDSAS